MRVVIGSDHAGLSLKLRLVEQLAARAAQTTGEALEFEDLGTHTSASVDYPDFAVAVARAVSEGRADRGILICGTGQGMAMAANRVTGIRAAVVGDCFTARATREHNDANVLCMGERVIGPGLASEIMGIFLDTPFAGGRHAGRLAKIAAIS